MKHALFSLLLPLVIFASVSQTIDSFYRDYLKSFAGSAVPTKPAGFSVDHYSCQHSSISEFHDHHKAVREAAMSGFLTPSPSLSSPSLSSPRVDPPGTLRIQLPPDNRACNSVGQLVPLGNSSNQYTCTTDDLLTSNFTLFVRNYLAPAARAVIQQMIGLRFVTIIRPDGVGVSNLIDPLILDPRVSNLNNRTCGADVYIPANFFNSTGEPNTDLSIFITGRPDIASSIPVPSNGNPCAWVFYGLVASTVINSRPLAGSLNINPASFLQFTSFVSPPTALEFSKAVRLIVHEMIHILGFDSNFYASWLSLPNSATGQYNPYIILNRNGTNGAGESFNYSVRALRATYLTDRLRNFYTNGPGILNIYLEDSDPNFRHLEMRNYHNEIMTIRRNDFMPITIFTLAILEATGWYNVNRSVAEPFTFGHNEGLNFLEDPCHLRRPPYFCNISASGCSVDRACKINTYQTLPVQYRHFPNTSLGGRFMEADYCPYFEALNGNDFPIQHCLDPTGIPNTTVFEQFTPSSRCFPYAFSNISIPNLNPLTACWPSSCLDGSSMNVTINNTFQICTYSKSNPTTEFVIEIPPLLNGSIRCPETVNEFCAYVGSNILYSNIVPFTFSPIPYASSTLETFSQAPFETWSTSSSESSASSNSDTLSTTTIIEDESSDSSGIRLGSLSGGAAIGVIVVIAVCGFCCIVAVIGAMIFLYFYLPKEYEISSGDSYRWE